MFGGEGGGGGGGGGEAGGGAPVFQNTALDRRAPARSNNDLEHEMRMILVCPAAAPHCMLLLSASSHQKSFNGVKITYSTTYLFENCNSNANMNSVSNSPP